MVFNSGFEGEKSNASAEACDKSITSKTSVNEKSVEEAKSRRPKSSSASEVSKPKKNQRIRSRTIDVTDLNERLKSHFGKPDFPPKKGKKPSDTCEKGMSDTNLRKKTNDADNEGEKSARTNCNNGGKVGFLEPAKGSRHGSLGGEDVDLKKSDALDVSEEGTSHTGSSRSKISGSKKINDVPKPKTQPLRKASSGTASKLVTAPSKLPVKVNQSSKDSEERQADFGGSKTRPDSAKATSRMYRGKKESKLDEKVNEALSENFNTLVPLYEKELRKITEAWVNTIYCSLTMRTNLVKLLHQAFPNLNRTQFQMEDEKLLHCITHAKSCTKLEIQNLTQFIKALLTTREKAKEQFRCVMANKDVAEIYNYDWGKLTRQITEIGEGAKQLQMKVPDLQKSKEAFEETQREKIRNMEAALASKEEELQKLINQLALLRQKETSYKGNVIMKIQDYKDIKADVLSLKSTEKEFEEVKAKFNYQNETYEKKVKDLEVLLEDKKKTLEKEKEVKDQLQTLLEHFQAQQKRLATSVGKEQMDFVGGRSHVNRDRRRQQLWLAAVKLVLRGFLVQIKKLERDRNKMLLELQSNDSENFNSIATSIIKKDNFIRSIQHQVTDYEKAFNYSRFKNPENPCVENL